MSRIADLKMKRAEHLETITAMDETAKTEKRDLTDAERTKWDEINANIEKIDGDIKRAEQHAKRIEEAARMANPKHFNIGNTLNKGGEKGEMKQISKRYQLARAVNQKLNQTPIDGLEAEMQQEAVQEMQRFGASPEGIAMPSFMINIQRDLVVGTNTAGGYGVETELSDQMIPYLQPRLQTIAMGARVLSGLTSNVDIARNDAITSATWEGETDANAESEPTLDQIQLRPKRLGAYTRYSKQLLLQWGINPSVDSMVRQQLERAIAIKLDDTIINGSGTAPVPTGILNTTGVNSVAIGTNGGAMTHTHVVDLQTEVAIDNADMGALGYLTTPQVRGKLQTTKIDTGSGLFVWNSTTPGSLLGYNARVSTQVPSNLTKGTGTALNAMIYGNWNELMVAQWGGLDIVIDPYTESKNARVVVIINSWWDIALAHAESFAVCKDISVA